MCYKALSQIPRRDLNHLQSNTEDVCARTHSSHKLKHIFVLSTIFTRLFKELLEDLHRHFKHFVHKGAEFKMPNVNLA